MTDVSPREGSVAMTPDTGVLGTESAVADGVSPVVTSSGPVSPRRSMMRYVSVVCGIFAILGVAGVWLANQYPAPSELMPISVGGVSVLAAVADTDSERSQGLSGRPSMPLDEGLLFVFAEAGTYGFWMKDMQFPIDILWFDSSKQLVDVTRAVDPSTYPQTFTSQQPAQYVLEVNAGFADAHGVKLGDQLTF